MKKNILLVLGIEHWCNNSLKADVLSYEVMTFSVFAHHCRGYYSQLVFVLDFGFPVLDNQFTQALIGSANSKAKGKGLERDDD